MATTKKILDSTAFFSQSTLLNAIEDAANETILISPFPLAHAWPMQLMHEFGQVLLIRNILSGKDNKGIFEYLFRNNPYTELLMNEMKLVEKTVAELVRLGLAEYYDANAMSENDDNPARSHELRMAILYRRDEAHKFLLAAFDLDIIVHAVVNNISLYSSNQCVSSGELFRNMGLCFNANDGTSTALESVPISKIQEYLADKKRYESGYRGYSWTVARKVGKVVANLGVNNVPIVSNVLSFVTAMNDLKNIVDEHKASKFEHMRQHILQNIPPVEIQNVILEFNAYRMREAKEEPARDL